ncbi:MAG: lactonase family protein [Candidatus Tectimicrobiota bacterium]
MPSTVVYAGIGPELVLYDLDVPGAALRKQSSVLLPANIQYAWVHPSSRYLYVVASNGGPGVIPGDTHLASALRIEPASGTLTPHGAPQALPSRPIHCCVDSSGAYLLTVFNFPSAVTVHRINQDGTLGGLVPQPASLDYGSFAHQIRLTPAPQRAILVTRGNDATAAKPEDPGALKVFDFHQGVLTPQASIAPGSGMGFGPRHLDFHPQQPWVFVSVERQNQLQVYELRADHSLAATPLFTRTTLADPTHVLAGQAAGAIRVHPSGRFVYVTNRNSGLVDFAGTQVSHGGENSIAVFAIDQSTGEPTLIQHSDAQALHLRTLSIDPGGHVLVAASILPMAVRQGERVVRRAAGLSVQQIGSDGMLTCVRQYDVDTSQGMQFWSGMVTLASA